MKSIKSQIPELLFHTAKGFYDIGYNCANNVRSDEGITGFQRIAPGAVNLTFAAELFLKGLHLLISKEQLKSHHLNFLFSKLPEPIQKEIEEGYNFHKENQKEDKELGAYKIVIFSKRNNKSQPPESGSNLLKDFLLSHDKGFENWRYLHEIGEDGYAYEIDFNLLDCFLKSIIDKINAIPVEKRMYLKKKNNFS